MGKVNSMALSQAQLLTQLKQCVRALQRQSTVLKLLKSSYIGLLLGLLFITTGLLVWYLLAWPNTPLPFTNWASSDFTLWVMSTITTVMTWVLVSVFVALVCYMYFVLRDKPTGEYKNAYVFLAHLNRQEPRLEESAQLLLVPNETLTAMQSLQLQRILPVLEALSCANDKAYLPPLFLRKRGFTILFTILAGVLCISASLALIQQISTNKAPYIPVQTSISNKQANNTSINYISAISAVITPPTYTFAPVFEQNTLDISVLQGSQIEWFVPLPNASANIGFELTLSNGETLPFKQSSDGFKASIQANNALVYSITQSGDSGSFTSDVATVSVTMDAKPIITFQQPILTITEIPKNKSPDIPAIVEISDDYAITHVKIVASIAKGSGEAVKFRDQEFSFDVIDRSAVQQAEKQAGLVSTYTKNWDLVALDMEPGDELYFSVHATDNKAPNAQTTESPIKIIRWLEDEDPRISGDGIVIDFMPEYFKSQRQIIIETEALLEQAPSMSQRKFSQTSRALAVDQALLKESYGQYLGDEFETGVMQNMEAGPELPHADEHDHKDESEHADESDHADKGPAVAQTDHGHEHESGEQHADDKSGYQQIIDQYGHNHGEADIGFIKTSQGQINPKVLMKRALAAMWQAELHLQLSEPEQALPYEKEALSYINRAKQADRIYVKRLGFEPPPVSEERRYKGKLKDILSYQQNTQIDLPPSRNQQFVSLIQLINQQITMGTPIEAKANTLTPKAREEIDQLAEYLSSKLSEQPQWLASLATLKRIQLANSFELSKCANCLESLIADLSAQLTPAIAQPFSKTHKYSTNNQSVQAYSRSLLSRPVIQNQDLESSASQASQPVLQGNTQ